MGKSYPGLLILALCLTAACGGRSPQPEAPAVPEVPEQAEAPTPEPTATAAPANAAATDNLEDTLVIPGERVGPVTRETSHGDLVAMFGANALEDAEIPIGEGFTESGTRVNLGSERSFSVIWVDASRTRPATVKDFGTEWKTPEGIGVGLPFADLQDQLGTFELYGFGWDYQGTVVLESSALAKYYGFLILRLSPAADAPNQAPEAYQAVAGDSLFSSDNPNLLPLNLTVDEMIVYLNPPTQ